MDKVNVFVYKYKKSKDSDDWYLAFSGPQPLDKTEFDFSGEFTSVDWRPLEENRLDSQIKKLIYRLRFRDFD